MDFRNCFDGILFGRWTILGTLGIENAVETHEYETWRLYLDWDGAMKGCSVYWYYYYSVYRILDLRLERKNLEPWGIQLVMSSFTQPPGILEQELKPGSLEADEGMQCFHMMWSCVFLTLIFSQQSCKWIARPLCSTICWRAFWGELFTGRPQIVPTCWWDIPYSPSCFGSSCRVCLCTTLHNQNKSASSNSLAFVVPLRKRT